MSARDSYLTVLDDEHATTMRVLRAYPEEKLELRVHEKMKTARELAWLFVGEYGLLKKVWNDEFAKGVAGGAPPPPPEKWSDILSALEKAHGEARKMVAAASEAELTEKVHFFVAPKTMGEYSRLDFAWFLLHDHIHHRGQFSVYLRQAGGKVPSIYGPTADEPWN